MNRANIRYCAIYIPDFSGGGAEMVNVRLANAFAHAGLRVSLIVNENKGPLRAQVDPLVEVVSLRATRSLTAFPKFIRLLRSSPPDLLISGLAGNNLVSLYGKILSGWRGVLVVVQHNTFSLEFQKSRKHQALAKVLAMSFRLADRIVAVSAGVADDLAFHSGLRRDRISVIYNPIITPSFAALAAAEPNHPWYADERLAPFVAVGRLNTQKDYPTMLQALAAARRTVEARLLVLGDGGLKARLEELASSLGVHDSVRFLGFVENPLPYIRCASAIVLSSRYEGFGNVLAEAMACGTPVISTDTNGPAEILERGRLGALVPIGDVEAIAAAMVDAARTEPDRDRLRASAERFRVEAIAEQYLALAGGTG